MPADDHADAVAVACRHCGGDCFYIGQLGRRHYWRCRYCGADHSLTDADNGSPTDRYPDGTPRYDTPSALGL